MSVQRMLKELFPVQGSASKKNAPKKSVPRVSSFGGVPLHPERLTVEQLFHYCEKLRLKGEMKKALLEVLRPKVDAAKIKHDERFAKKKV